MYQVAFLIIITFLLRYIFEFLQIDCYLLGMPPAELRGSSAYDFAK